MKFHQTKQTKIIFENCALRLVTSTSGGRSFDGNSNVGFGDTTYFRLPVLEKITVGYKSFHLGDLVIRVGQGAPLQCNICQRIRAAPP